MTRARRISLVGILLAATGIGVAACGSPPEEQPAAAIIETVSLHIEGMT
jgi:hypothetical protein